MANAGFEEDREEPAPTPHQDKMRQAAFPSGQTRYATEHGGEIRVVSLSMVLMLAKQLEDTERELAKHRAELGAPDENRAAALWKLLDDIDTLDDAAKSNDAEFRRRCYDIQRKRFAIMSGEQYDILRSQPHNGEGKT